MTARARPRVAFQGELGAFSERGVAQHWAGRAEPVPMREFDAVARAVDAGEVDFGLLPVENVIAGPVTASLAAIAAWPSLGIVGETTVAIELCALALPGASLGTLRRVRSHPVALAQCGAFLRRHPHLAAEPHYDTAGAARDVAAAGDASVGAVASRSAAERYGLVVLAAGIGDRADNATRFVVLARGERR
jgi:prephenate dehydratase